jgi:hypothetical protein
VALQFDSMQPTFFIDHRVGPCLFPDPGAMREAWQSLELSVQLDFYGHVLGKPISGFRFGRPLYGDFHVQASRR